MVPSIEGLEARPPLIKDKMFSVLLDTPAPLDLAEFDRQSSAIASGDINAVLKWLVMGSRMFIFHNYQHTDVHQILTGLGNLDPLHSAGRLMVTRWSRTIGSGSDTLASILRKDDSDRYQREQLLPKLGEGFTSI